MNRESTISNNQSAQLRTRPLFIMLMLFGMGLLHGCQYAPTQAAAKPKPNHADASQILLRYQWLYLPARSATTTRSKTAAVVVQFNQNRINIKTGCNRLVGSWQLQRQQLRTSPLAGTKMACSPELMQQEQSAIAIFSNSTFRYRLNSTRSVPILKLHHNDGQVYTLIAQVK